MPCNCSNSAQERTASFSLAKYIMASLVAFVAWTMLYSMLTPFSEWVVQTILDLGKETSLGDAAAFFFYDTPKILLLLLLMVYLISWLRAGVDAGRIRDFLSGRAKGTGYLLAAGFGAVSPFCSCSTIPLFLGFISARFPLGTTMAFLITSPIINEVAVVLLWGLLGWKFAVTYIAVGMSAGIIGGILMDSVHAEKWLHPMFQKEQLTVQTIRSGKSHKVTFAQRHAFAMAETKRVFRKVWVWVVLGVAIGAGLHGYVPQNWFAEHMGSGQWWSVPLSVGAGIPLYTNATGIVPVLESLLSKGLPVGTTLAFCMSSVAVSLPEFMMLKQVMTWKLLLLFIIMLLAVFSLAGWFLNAAQTVIF